MKFPDEVAEAVLGILKETLLSIRVLGYEGKASECQIEAYHTHNLPSLIKDYKYELLTYYLEIERPQYIRESTRKTFETFEPHWKRLEEFVQRNVKSASN